MKHFPLAVAALFALVALTPFRTEEKENAFLPMFNGKDLTGWVNVQSALDAGLAGSPEKGTFVLRPGGEMQFGNLFVREPQ